MLFVVRVLYCSGVLKLCTLELCCDLNSSSSPSVHPSVWTSHISYIQHVWEILAYNSLSVVTVNGVDSICTARLSVRLQHLTLVFCARVWWAGFCTAWSRSAPSGTQRSRHSVAGTTGCRRSDGPSCCPAASQLLVFHGGDCWRREAAAEGA